jgi:hypothetical protein
MGPAPPPEVYRDSRGFAVEPVAGETGYSSYPAYGGMQQQQPGRGVLPAGAGAGDLERGFSSSSDHSPPQEDRRGFSSSRGMEPYRGGPPPYPAGSGFDPRFAPPPPPPPPRNKQQQQQVEKEVVTTVAASARMPNGGAAAVVAENGAAAGVSTAVPRADGMAAFEAGKSSKEEAVVNAVAAGPAVHTQEVLQTEEQKTENVVEEQKVRTLGLTLGHDSMGAMSFCCVPQLGTRGGSFGAVSRLQAPVEHVTASSRGWCWLLGVRGMVC